MLKILSKNASLSSSASSPASMFSFCCFSLVFFFLFFWNLDSDFSLESLLLYIWISNLFLLSTILGTCGSRQVVALLDLVPSRICLFCVVSPFWVILLPEKVELWNLWRDLGIVTMSLICLRIGRSRTLRLFNSERTGGDESSSWDWWNHKGSLRWVGSF